MAGKWQLWYPHKIDAWQGSATIQTFSHAAYRGFHNLIMEQFQAPDGMLPDDDRQLARMSRLGLEWESVKDEVRAALKPNGAGRIYSATQYTLWLDASNRHEEYIGRMEKARQIKAQHKAQFNGLNNPQTTHNTVDALTETGTKTGKKKKNKTCAADARAASFRDLFQDAFKVKNGIDAPWDGKEAANLARFLKSNPKITPEQWQHILFNRHNSPINHKASLSQWIGRALAWIDGPADEWGKPLKNSPANVLPFQPAAVVSDTSERRAYEMWSSMSEEHKRQNPWIGPIPAERKVQ